VGDVDIFRNHIIRNHLEMTVELHVQESALSKLEEAKLKLSQRKKSKVGGVDIFRNRIIMYLV
jgi:hypothetical protein